LTWATQNLKYYNTIIFSSPVLLEKPLINDVEKIIELRQKVHRWFLDRRPQEEISNINHCNYVTALREILDTMKAKSEAQQPHFIDACPRDGRSYSQAVSTNIVKSQA
jgi:hypothetical protein